MGFLKKITSNLTDPTIQFTNIVKACDNGEEWAKCELQKMWQNNDPTLIKRIHQARVAIYEKAAKNGDKDAIIKYAHGLAYCNRHQEILHWYMQLIEKKDLETMLELALDYAEYSDFNGDKIKHTKSNLTETVKSLYYTIESLCIEITNKNENNLMIDNVFRQLYSVYLYPPKSIGEPMPYRAAYYIYKSAYIYDNQLSLNRLQKTATKYNLGITQRTLQEWNEMSFDEWAELHNINE